MALRRREAEESVTSIARHLGVGRSTLYRTFAAYDEAIATGREPGTPSSMVGPSEAPVQGA
ncbi:helix-turn-helix domain-containing protein [Streptomyces sp. NPDC087538]|uniref:helix-turn-helix domain-containing protein n=1 Tax=Streptomyces sp. NPDC087538 TaxID=3365797 RepID=UPI00382A0BA0